MILQLNNKNMAVGFVLGERWLTTALLKLGARQSIKVVMLCQRPIHTHSTMSVGHLISSSLHQYIFKNRLIPLIRKPFISVQLPEKLYEKLIIKKPVGLKLTGAWAASLLTDEGYNLNEWRWDVVLSGESCIFLLMKVVDFYEQLQPFKKALCAPNTLSFIDPQVANEFVYEKEDNHMTVLPDPLAANQAIYLAAQNLIKA